MKKTFFLLLLLISITKIQAQKVNDAIPAYRLLNQDSVYITQANLKKDKPVMIIYFSPDCSHCQRMTYEFKEEFAKEIKSGDKTLRNVQIVMATWTQLKSIQVFYHDFGLSKYPNITVGTEGYTYTLQKYYQVKNTPFIAIYSKSGQLVKAYDKITKMDELLAMLKKV